MCSSLETSSEESAISTEKKSYSCTYENCTATFSKNSKLLYHVRRHTGERPFACDEPNCSKAYFYSFHLRRHKERHTNTRIACPVDSCYLELANKYSLKKHIKRKHNPDRIYPFSCETCNQGFHRKKHLLHHIYTHTGIPSFECPICKLKFGILRDLGRHKRTHMKYSCNCGAKFERWTALLVHKKECQSAWHTCAICEKKFRQKTNLNSHMATHLEPEEKFTCGYDNCGRSYLYKKNLIQHIRRYHQKMVKKIVCPMYGANCNKTFSKNQNLKYHMRRFHSDQAEVKKTVRKTRKDKGIAKTSMAALLSGTPLSQKDHLNVIKGLPIKLPQLYKKDNTVEKEKTDQDRIILRNCGSESDVCDDTESDFIKVVC